MPPSNSSYVEFPAAEEIVGRLRRIGSGWPSRDGIYRTIAAQFADRTLDSAAVSFMLIEILHRHEAEIGEDLASFLPKCILALTEDEDLARSARAAFRELGSRGAE